MPALGRRRVVDRRHDLDQAVLHRDLDAEAAELAAGLHLHFLEALGVHVARMRIERSEHAVDGGLDQLLFIRRLDIVGAHAVEHVAEQIELLVGIGIRRRDGAVEGLPQHRRRDSARQQPNQLNASSCQASILGLARSRRSTRATNRSLRRFSGTQYIVRAGRPAPGRRSTSPARRFSHHPTGSPALQELSLLGRDLAHACQEHMIAAAGVQDQELAVGAEGPGEFDMAVGRGTTWASARVATKTPRVLPPKPSFAP